MRKRLIIGTSVIIVLAGLGTSYWYFGVRQTNEDTGKPKPVNTINYDPPSAEEKAETERFKETQQNTKPPVDQPKAEDGRTKVTPVISYAGQYDSLVEISSYIPGIFEDGGTCTLKLTSGSVVVTRTTTGVKDATTTRCPIFQLASKDIKPKGSWTATVSYSSEQASGTSQKMNFEVK